MTVPKEVSYILLVCSFGYPLMKATLACSAFSADEIGYSETVSSLSPYSDKQ